VGAANGKQPNDIRLTGLGIVHDDLIEKKSLLPVDCTLCNHIIAWHPSTPTIFNSHMPIILCYLTFFGPDEGPEILLSKEELTIVEITYLLMHYPSKIWRRAFRKRLRSLVKIKSAFQTLDKTAGITYRICPSWWFLNSSIN
jgi:hypothetical protein